MSQSKLSLSGSTHRLNNSIEEVIPQPDTLLKPTHDSEIEIHTAPIKTGVYPTPNIFFYERRIEELERDIEDYQFEHEANIVYNKQFKILGKLLGNQEMEFEEIRQKLEDLILEGPNPLSQTIINNPLLQSSCNENQQFISKLNGLLYEDFIEEIVKSDQIEFWRILSVLSCPEMSTQSGIASHKTVFFNFWKEIIETKFLKDEGFNLKAISIQQQNTALMAEKQRIIHELTNELEKKGEQANRISKDFNILQESYKQLQIDFEHEKRNMESLEMEVRERKKELLENQEHMEEYQGSIKRMKEEDEQKIQLLNYSLKQAHQRSERNLRDMTQQIQKLHQEISRYKEETEHIENINHKQELQIKQQSIQLGQQLHQIKSLQKSIQEQELINQQLNQQLMRTKQNYQQNYDKQSEQISKLISRVENLEKQLVKMGQQIQEKDEIINDKNQELNVIRADHERVTMELAELANQYQRQMNEDREVMKNGSSLSEDLELSEKTSEFQQITKELENKIKTKEDQINEKVKIMNNLQIRNNASKQKIKILQDQIDVLQRKIKQLQKQLSDALQTQHLKLSRASPSLQFTVAELTDTIKKITHQNKILDLENEKLHHDNEDYISRIANYQKEAKEQLQKNKKMVQSLEEKLDAERQRNIVLEEQRKKEQQKYIELSSKASLEQQEVKQIEELIEQQKIHIQSLITKNDDLQEKLSALSINHEQLLAINQKYVQQAQEFVEENRRLSQRITELLSISNQAQQMKQILDHKTQQMNEVCLTLNSLKLEKSILQQNQINLKSQIQRLKENLILVQKCNIDLQNINRGLKNEKDELSHENHKIKNQLKHYQETISCMKIKTEQIVHQNQQLLSQMYTSKQNESKIVNIGARKSSNLMNEGYQLQQIAEANNSQTEGSYQISQISEEFYKTDNNSKYVDTKQSETCFQNYQSKKSYQTNKNQQQRLSDIKKIEQNQQYQQVDQKNINLGQGQQIRKLRITENEGPLRNPFSQINETSEGQKSPRKTEIESGFRKKLISDKQISENQTYSIHTFNQESSVNTRTLNEGKDVDIQSPTANNNYSSYENMENIENGQDESMSSSPPSVCHEAFNPVSIRIIGTQKGIASNSKLSSGKFIIRQGVSQNISTNKSINAEQIRRGDISQSKRKNQRFPQPLSVKIIESITPKSDQKVCIQDKRHSFLNVKSSSALLHTFQAPKITSPPKRAQSKFTMPTNRIVVSHSRSPQERRPHNFVKGSIYREVSPRSKNQKQVNSNQLISRGLDRVTSAPPKNFLPPFNVNTINTIQTRTNTSRQFTSNRNHEGSIQKIKFNKAPPYSYFDMQKKGSYWSNSPYYRYNNTPFTSNQGVSNERQQNNSEYFSKATLDQLKKDSQREMYTNGKYKKIDGISESNESGIEVAQRNFFQECCPEC